jgi:anti-sigma factor RsiW
MTDWNTQLKIQAFLDGELPEGEAREIAALIASDLEAAMLHTELKNTRRALSQAESGLRVPETREFYWSKINREIERLEQRDTDTSSSPSDWYWLARFVKLFVPVAAVVLIGYFAFLRVEQKPSVATGATEVQVALANAEAITFRDFSDDTTFIWFSYPAETGTSRDGSPTTIN